jgi:hypothetical protein
MNCFPENVPVVGLTVGSGTAVPLAAGVFWVFIVVGVSSAVGDDEIDEDGGKLNDMRKTKISSSMPVRINAPEMVKPKRGVSLLARNEVCSSVRECDFNPVDGMPVYGGASGAQPVVGSGVFVSGIEAIGVPGSQSGCGASGSAILTVAEGGISFPGNDS